MLGLGHWEGGIAIGFNEQTNEKAPGSEQTDQTTAASDWGDHCIENCLYHGHHENKDMVRCCQCASWVHNDCISQREELVPGVWSCFRCRLVPTQVQDLVSSVAALTKLVTDLSETTIKLQKQHETTASLLKEKEDAYQKLLADNQQLRLRVAEVSSAASEETWRQFPRPHGTALLGSSVIRDIDQTKLVATKCVCIRGGHIKDIQGAVDRLPNDRKLCRIVLAVGGNDCDSGEDKPVTDIVAEYKDLIESAKTIAASVTVSSVCPRRKSTEVIERIDALNAGLQGLCSDLQVDFIDNNPAFHLQDGSFNEGYLLPDNVHLTRAATNKLVSNLKFELRQGHTTAHSDHRRKGHAPDGTSDESDCSSEDDMSALDVAHPFWQKVIRKSRPRKLRISGGKHGNHNGPQPNHATAAPNAAQHREVPVPLMAIQTRPPTPQRPDNNHCQLCLGNGHTAVTCRSKDSQCYKCSKYGQLARACLSTYRRRAWVVWASIRPVHSVWTPFHSIYENSTLCTNWFVHQANTAGAFIVHQANAAGTFIVHQGNVAEHFGSYIKAERSSPTVQWRARGHHRCHEKPPVSRDRNTRHSHPPYRTGYSHTWTACPEITRNCI